MLPSVAVSRAVIAVVVCVCLWSAQASASDHGAERLYLGVGAGMIDNSSGSGLDLDAAGPSLRLGYEFNQRLSAELGYLALGEDEDESDSWSASLVVTFPLTAIDLYGRLGAMYNDRQPSQLLGSGLETTGATSTRGFAALGAQVRFRRFDLYGEYSRVDRDSNDDVDIFSAGLKFRF